MTNVLVYVSRTPTDRQEIIINIPKNLISLTPSKTDISFVFAVVSSSSSVFSGGQNNKQLKIDYKCHYNIRYLIGGVIIYQNAKVPYRPRYYEYMGKMRPKIPKH